MSQGLAELLGKDFSSLTMADNGTEFAEKVIRAAKEHRISLKSIPELRYADLDGNDKIEEKEIAALIYAAHEKRTGSEFETLSSGTGVHDGRAVRNVNYDPAITVSDIRTMTDPDVVMNAKLHLQSTWETPKVEELLHAIDKETMDALKGIRGGIEVQDSTLGPTSPIQSTLRKSNSIGR